MITVVGMPAAAWQLARPLTASPSPPVRANGQYSAVRWVTPIRSAGSIWGRGAAAAAARRGCAGLRRRDFGAGVVAPMRSEERRVGKECGCGGAGGGHRKKKQRK